MNTIRHKQGMHMNTRKHRHMNTQTQNIQGNIIQTHLGIFPDVWGEVSQKRSGTFPKLGAKFLTNTRNVPNYLFFERGSRRFSEADRKSAWTTNSIFSGGRFFVKFPKTRTFPNFCRGGTHWRHSEKQSPTTFGIGNVPDCLLKMPSFGRSSPKTLGNVPEFFLGDFSGPRKHSGTFLKFFSGEADFGGDPRNSPQKHSGTFPNFFSERLTLGEILGSSPQKHSDTFPNFSRRGWLLEIFGRNPQKHSGTFPNVFWGGWLLGKSSGSSPQKHSGMFPIFFGAADFRWNPPCPSFPCFLGKRQGKPPKKQGFFIPTEPLKIPGKEGKNARKNKEILARRKNKEI